MKTPIFAFTLSMIMCLGARAELKWEQTASRAASRRQRQTGDRPFQVPRTPARRRCTLNLFTLPAVAPLRKARRTKCRPEKKARSRPHSISAIVRVTQVKTVTVETDEAVNQKTVLTLKAEIPQQLEITPNFVFWKQGEKADTKTINVKVGKDFTVKHIKVTSSTPDFEAKVEEAGKGQFKIDVKPQDTNKVVASMLTIQPEDSQKVFYATARITNAPPD